MTTKYDQLIAACKDKHVHIATHWDCDGVCSGAILYHMIKPHAKKVTTISKGEVFLVFPHECPPEADVIICSDIQPSPDLDPKKTIYIDHHPLEYEHEFLMTIHNIDIQSCSLLIWEQLIPTTDDPFLIFLSMLGYFGDSGKFDDLPIELVSKAHTHFPQLLFKRKSQFGPGTYIPLQMFVSMFNTGKRMHWNGMVPLELLKQVTKYTDITQNKHPLVDELQRYKLELRQYYNKTYDFEETSKLKIGMIECDKNIQGVICARYMKDKPIIVVNKLPDKGIASMRVPDDMDFDAGAFLAKFKEIVPDIVGGGHEKAGGITFPLDKWDVFLTYLHDYRGQPF